MQIPDGVVTVLRVVQSADLGCNLRSLYGTGTLELRQHLRCCLSYLVEVCGITIGAQLSKASAP